MRPTIVLIIVWLILIGGFGPVEAQQLQSLTASLSGDTLCIEFPYHDFIIREDSLTLVAGEDIAIICRLELWQKRRMWFDRLRATRFVYSTLSYDRWDERFVLTRQEESGWETSRRFATLNQALDCLTQESPLCLALEPDDLDRESFVACALDIEYLTMEKLKELQGWLRSGDHGDRDGNSLPDKILGFLMKSTGLKNRSSLKTSENFYPAELTSEIKF